MDWPDVMFVDVHPIRVLKKGYLVFGSRGLG